MILGWILHELEIFKGDDGHGKRLNLLIEICHNDTLENSLFMIT